MRGLDRFFKAFKRADMLETATFGGVPFQVGPRESDGLILGGAAQSLTTVIEYETGVVTLKRGDVLSFRNRDWRVKVARILDSGVFSEAELE